ncbi:hypothetical protein Bca101_081696 [Brassica carinata]
MLRKLARNPTKSSSEKPTSANVVDLDTTQESLVDASDLFTEEVAGTEDELEQDTSDQEQDMQSLSVEKPANVGEISDDEQEQVAADSEDEEFEDEATGFVYQELGPRIENLRTQHQARLAASPSLHNMVQRPFNGTFDSAGASARHEHLIYRTVLIQKFLPEVDPDLLDTRSIIENARLMYTVMDVPSFTQEIVLEFYANLENMIKRDGTTWVYLRGHMYKFSPTLINNVFQTPRQEADFPQKPWTKENLDDAVNTIKGGKKKKWGNLKMLDVTPTMNILFKLCVFNWMPTANHSTLTRDRIKFIHMITEGRPFDFGTMVFDQIYELGQQTDSGMTNKLLFPNLIQHVMDAQHPIPAHMGDSDPQAAYKMVLDKKQGLPKNPPGTGASRRYSLTTDIGRVYRYMDTVISRAAKGIYGDLSNLGDGSSHEGECAEDRGSDEF